MTERDTQARIRLALGAEPSVRLFRNQVGSYRLPDGRWITSGLCVGSPDLIGWRTFVVETADVGRAIAVFAGIECKSMKGRSSIEQLNFGGRLTEAGGLWGVARSVDEARRILGMDR